jgi:hypothetical protein
MTLCYKHFLGFHFAATGTYAPLEEGETYIHLKTKKKAAVKKVVEETEVTDVLETIK